MHRREFITLLGGAAAGPLAARATMMPVVGYLGSSSLEPEREFVAAFHRGLAETGYVEGRNRLTRPKKPSKRCSKRRSS
jgi:putative ABC transport system substrate-binding protein